MKLNFSNQTKVKISPRVFSKFLPKIEKILGLVKGQGINLILVTDQEIQKINNDYRGIDQPTDVLAFAYQETLPFPGERSLGEIFISVEKAKGQAKKLGHSLGIELEILFVHGILHLLGFEHDNPKKEKIMQKTAREILG